MPTHTSFLEIRGKFDQIFDTLKIWREYYICLCRGAAVTTGFAFAQRFVDNAAVSVLVLYFTDINNLPNAVAMVNILEGLSSILVRAMTYISKKHVSPLKVILYSNAAYITGMVMLCISAFHPIRGDMTGMCIVLVLLLISVGRAGGLPILEEFLVGQLTAHEPRELDKDEGRVRARKTVWWSTASLLCFLTYPAWIFGHAGWRVTFICSTSVMGIGYLLFLGCIPLYHRSVDDAAAANTDLERAVRWEGDTFFTASDPPPMDDSSKSTEKDQDCSTVNEEEEGEEEEEEGEGGFCSFLKVISARLDYNAPILRAEKATEEEAIRELEKQKDKESASNNGPAAAVCAGRSLVEQWKPLSVMIPMWTTFLVFGLVLSTGDTLFTEQESNMDPTVSIYVVLMIREIISATSSFFTAILLKCVPKPQQTQGIIVGIWTAMVLSVFCCSVAWRFEIRRLRAIEESNFCVKFNEDDKAFIPMSILRLAPQFCLLGLMEGIGKQGLDLFFEAQVPDVPMKKYGSELNDAVVGFGNFLNALLVLCIKSWFGHTLNCSGTHLDRYYQMLMILSFVNLCYYWFVSTFYPNKKETKDSVEIKKVALEEIGALLVGLF